MRLPPLLVPVLLVTVSTTAHPADKKKDPGEIGKRDVGKGINFYSLEKEIALGRQLASEVLRQAKVVDDPIVSEYINRMGQNLVRNSDAQVPFTFQVIESDQPNAFALPGGFVFVHTGLIKMSDEESELAGAMAHEIAHVAARHMTRQATKAQIANLATIPLSVLLGGWAGYGARQAAAPVTALTSLRFSREDESEADSLGVQYMYAAGYDPGGSVSLFEKLESLERKKPGVLSGLLSTHPPDAVRLRNVQDEIQRNLPARSEYVVNTSTYTEMRRRLFAQQATTKNSAEPDRPKLRNRGDGQQEDRPGREDRPTIRRSEWVD